MTAIIRSARLAAELKTVPVPRLQAQVLEIPVQVHVQPRAYGQPVEQMPSQAQMPLPVAAAAPAKAPPPAKTAALRPITITHPDRVVYPDAGVTKGEIAAYYEAVADWMAPHLLDRPCSIIRAPDGIGGERFAVLE